MVDYNTIKALIKNKAHEFGFLEARIAGAIISLDAKTKFNEWLSKNYAGDMRYLKENIHLRFNPSLLHPKTLSIISVKAPYLTRPASFHKDRLSDPNHAYISSYALGRDYHKLVKQQLNKYAKWINSILAEYDLDYTYRAFTDSAPIMEVEVAKDAGLGWRGKNTLLLNKNQGSMFFLGELFTTLPLQPDTATTSHCGSCQKCLEICPTQAFVKPYVLDATKCISYLTIENKGPIPVEYRKALGNRIYGCDDCQLFCPWNKFSQLTTLADFKTRNNLDSSTLVELFSWNEEEFKQKMQGSPIYRIGYEAWQRNLAVGLGNAPKSHTQPNIAVIASLKQKLKSATPMVAEHIRWALAQHLS